MPPASAATARLQKDELEPWEQELLQVWPWARGYRAGLSCELPGQGLVWDVSSGAEGKQTTVSPGVLHVLGVRTVQP